MLTKKEAMALLIRVADNLDHRGIEPASDIEKLRALAYQVEQKWRRKTDANTATLG